MLGYITERPAENRDEFKAVPIDQLIKLPSRLQHRGTRSGVVSRLLTAKLNEMVRDGWELVTTYRGADETIFIFRRSLAVAR